MTAVAGKEPAPYTVCISDTVIRKCLSGIPSLTGASSVLPLLVGTPQTCRYWQQRSAAELQEKYMLTFLAGKVIPALSGAGVRLGLEYRLIPLGSTPFYGVHFVDIIARVAMMFGGVPAGSATPTGS